MVELIAVLLREGFELWVVSASNVWSVRWMMLKGLAPLLRPHGIGSEGGIRPERVIGISTLLQDRGGRLYKDPLLTEESPGYASLRPQDLRRFTLTNRLHFPVPAYSGKVACLFDRIGGRPYLCAGDSPGDHAMLAYSRNRLWLARDDKPGYQATRAALPARAGSARWISQPVAGGERPAFRS
jgi:hypothetical protein